MPGTVVSAGVGVGDQVVTGQSLVVVEAMKMEHTLTGPFRATVTAVHVAPGERVALRQVLLTLEPT